MLKLPFTENPMFYKNLDAAVEHGPVAITFPYGGPEKNSKLWKRLAKCQGWKEIEAEFKKIEAGKTSPLASILPPSMMKALGGGELLLAAFIATLLSGLFAYAIYKGRNVKLVVKDKDGREAEIVINDPESERSQKASDKTA